MPSFFIDDNARPLHDSAGLRPMALAATIASATTGAATAEISLAAVVGTALRNASGEAIVRVVVTGNACFYAFDAAAQGAAHTAVTNMAFLPANTIEYVKIRVTDVSFYHLQSTGAGTVQVTVMQ